MLSAPAILVLGPSGLPLARQVQAALGGGEIHGAKARLDEVDVLFESFPEHVRGLYRDGRPIVGICAAGILIRTLAPVLADKRQEPPVVAVAEDGSAVVPLLGGHHGANALAREIAAALGIQPAVTTPGDLRFGVALDEPPEGWSLANPEDAKAVMAALLAGASARIAGPADWLRQADLPVAEDGAIELLATDRCVEGSETRLVYHPKRLALGVGCERGCAPEELIALVEETLAGHDLAPGAVALVGSIDLKADEPAVHALAERLGVPARFFDAQRLSAEAPRLANPSELVEREVGCPGVAEGAALAAAGPQGALIIEKTKSARATCAVARAPVPIDAHAVGRARGRLSVVGVGPGAASWRSPEASTLLRAAGDWVGYGLYLDLVAELGQGKREHRFALGEEEARARHALELAGEGRDVALICSGDAGIYAMASLVFELLDVNGRDPGLSDGARRAEIVVAPGISALQAAAARAGAPLGHDFCAISLSDLLTPWEVIEQRLQAAAQGDFVVALYNPKSMKRQDQIVRAMEILRAHRPDATPVTVAANLGRPEERVAVTTLAAFDPGAVDMLSLVLVGASTTRAIETGAGRPRVYTPRGYARKREAP